MANQQIELSVGGMTCASCSRRVQKALERVEGVTASVNYATGVALIEAPIQVSAADLVTRIEHTGYSAAVSGRAVERYGLPEFRQRLLICAVLTLPLMVISMVTDAQFDGWQIVSFFLATPVALWGAWPFHRVTLLNLKRRQITMDTLVSVGVAVSYLWSVWALLFTSAGTTHMKMALSILAPVGHTAEPTLYFEVAASVTTLVLLGKYLEHRARAQSLLALENLATLHPQEALVIRDGAQVVTPIAQVVVGDVMLVRTGSQIPVDSDVIEGDGHVDKSMVTGEAVAQRVTQGDKVIGATVLVDGVITVRATAVGADTVLAAISRLVHQAQAGKARVANLVDRVSAVFVPIVVVLATATAIVWLVNGYPAQTAMTVGISVLVIACPCALGLATPTAFLVGTGRGAQLGILIRSPQALESSESIDVMMLDKTGTLTTGEMKVTDVVSTFDDAQLWNIVHSLEQTSTHPIAQSLTKHALSQGASAEVAQRVVTVSGSGLQGFVDGHPCAIGSVAWLGVPEGQLRDAHQAYAQQGKSTVVVYHDAFAVAVIAIADVASPDSAAAVKEIKKLGIEPVLVSGDHHDAVARVAQALGISQFHAGVSPEGKVELVAAAQEHGRRVAMVGDGVNDAAALAKAHLSIAMGTGTDVAMSSADIVLMRSSATAIVDAIRLSRATMRIIKSNLFWAFGYNIVAIPLAMTGRLGPVVAAGAMAFSSVFVVSNSLRLRKFH